MKLPAWPVPSKRLWQKATVTAGVTAAHALFFFLLCFDVRPVASGDAGALGQAVSLSLVEAAPAAASPPPSARRQKARPAETKPIEAVLPEEAPVTEEPVLEDALPLSQADLVAVAAFELPPSAGMPGEACNLTPRLSAGFAASPEVRLGLAGMPVAQRSVANAIMLWDGGWPEDTRFGGKALLRALLVKAVLSAPPACLDQDQRGPVLFFVPDGATTAVLAVGSGEWRWGDLIAPPAIPGQGGNYFLSAASEIRTTP